MNKKEVFPFCFFVVTFLWSWLIWLPLVLAGNGVIPISKDVLQAISTPKRNLTSGFTLRTAVQPAPERGLSQII